MSDKTSIRYNPDLQRTEKTKASLALAGERHGIVKGVIRDGTAPTPIMTTNCPHCNKTCPATNKGFVCTSCVVIFL